MTNAENSNCNPQKGIGIRTRRPKKIEYFIESLDDEAKEIGLIENRIATKIELKIRSIIIELVAESSDQDGWLYVNINVVHISFSIKVEYCRILYYLIGDQHYITTGTTWNNSTTGTHGNNSEYIIQSLGEEIDKFLNEFLKVNPKK